MVTITIDPTVFDAMIDVFAKTLSRTPVTKDTDPTTGDESLTDSSSNNIVGAFFKKETKWAFEKWGEVEEADAILLFKRTGVTLNRNDKLTFDSEDYRVKAITKRFVSTVLVYYVAHLFRMN